MRVLHLLLLILGMNMQRTMADQVSRTMEDIHNSDVKDLTYENIKQLTNLNPIDILGDYLTPRGENVSLACQQSGEYYKQMLAEQIPWAMQMFDADPKFPKGRSVGG